MKRISLIVVVLIFCFSGCAGTRYKSDLKNTLQPTKLRYSYNTQQLDLRKLSKCDELSVNFINDETRNEDMNIVPGAIFSPSWNINPKELTDDIIKYMENSYRFCRVPPDRNSKKKIHISIKEIIGWPTGIFRFVSYSRLKLAVSIPEINYHEIYTLDRSSPYLHDAMAYSIHDFTWDFINDPIIQDYILCR